MTEYLARGSLFDRLHPKWERQPPFSAHAAPPGSPPPSPPRPSLSRVLRYAEGTAAGMAYLHSLSIVHRDLKSPNLLLDAHDNVKGALTQKPSHAKKASARIAPSHPHAPL